MISTGTFGYNQFLLDASARRHDASQSASLSQASSDITLQTSSKFPVRHGIPPLITILPSAACAAKIAWMPLLSPAAGLPLLVWEGVGQ